MADVGFCPAQSVGTANQLLGLLIQTIFVSECSISAPDVWPADFGPYAANGDEYDFIVVGAGSAGSVIANRLSENPDWNVLLLEAGGSPPIETEIPKLFLNLQGTPIDWHYYTEPNNFSSLGLAGGRMIWNRGKMLGGSGQMNANYYIRGNSRDYDNWEKMGNPGWGWEQALKYFKKSEDNLNPRYVADSHYHAAGGLLKVGKLGAPDEAKNMIINGYKEMGYKLIDISNADKYLGYFEAQGTIFEGQRYGAAKAFLASAGGRSNLNIIQNAHVTTLTFAKDGSVNGVKFELNGLSLSAYARKEVVVSAGTVNTPQLLMLSGIGPRDELERHNIPVRVNLPVGLNLQDQPLILIAMAFENSTATPVSLTELADEVYQYMVHQKGTFASLGGGDLVFFFSTKNDPNFPDIQVHSLDYDVQDSGLAITGNAINLQNDAIESLTLANANAKVSVFAVCLLNPKSRGRIQLASASPFDAPLIHANFLSEKDDLDVIVKGAKMVNEFSKTKTFAKHQGQKIRLSVPACDKLKYESDSYWECYARQLTATFWHPVGTSKMGPVREAETVVDSELKVKGVNGLRVVDASIMPRVTSGNTNAPTIMIAEKASDMIKSKWL